MESKAKIPTLLGIGLIFIGLGAGIFLANQNQVLKSKASPSVEPQNIGLANLSATRASVYWQTQVPTIGFIELGDSPLLTQTFRDERDLQSPQEHQLHFVTLTGLQPNTTYYYKINSGILTYPPSEFLTFTTLPQTLSFDYQPLIGTIIDTSLKPVPEALITLEVAGMGKLAAISKIAGTFLLPLAEIHPASATTTTPTLSPNLPAQLTFFDNKQQSQITINPFSATAIPSPLVLGGNQTLSTPTPTIKTINFDLNRDGKVNSLDRSIILKNFKAKPSQKEADLNQDGVVNNQDLQMMDQAVAQ